MTTEELLKGKTDCDCGKSHLCPIDSVIIEENAFDKLPFLTKEYNKILLVADTNTYAVAGKEVESRLKSKLSNTLIYHRNGVLVPDETSIDELKQALSACGGCDLIIGVGSGVINDLCKHVSFISQLPYFIIATAPSMDGYASKGAALILNGMKVTLNANPPKVILADVNVLKDAPFEMIQAGYGDIIGKYSCLNDWKLANVILDEYFCPFIYQETMSVVEQTVHYAKGLKNRDKDAVGALMTALVAVGVFMAYVGNSRPASGSEHHLSHFFEIVGILKNEKYLAHGIDVCFSAIETAKIREGLLKLKSVDEYSWKFDRQAYEKDIMDIYGALANEIFALQEKEKSYQTDRVALYREKWSKILEVLKIAPSSAKMLELVENIGLSYAEFQQFYGKEKIETAIRYAKDLKDRYTVLWLNYDLEISK